MVEREVVFGVDSHIIHINLKPFLRDHIGADVIHECLESGRCIAEAEEHDGWFEQSQRGYESSFPLVLLSEVDIVISPTYVKLSEDGGVLHVVDEFRDQG